MSGGGLETQLDRPYAQQDETRTDVFAYVVRRGYPDILAALGVADVPEPPLSECPYCTTRLVALCVWHGEHAIAPPPVPKEPPTADGRPACPTCGRPRRRAKHGGHEPCRRELCSGEAP